VFESGAILLYLAEKTGGFIAPGLRGRVETLQWLFWQMAGLGPMAGQNHHFSQYAPEKLPYAIDRYMRETARLYGVLNKRHAKQGQPLEDFPHLARWFAAIRARPATQRAYERGRAINTAPTVSEESKKLLFGQSAASVR
jgi:GST-like protein